MICGDVASQQSVSKAGVEAGADTDAGGIENTTPAALQVEADPAPPPDRCFRLRQWPKPMLLAESGRMRLATLITGRAMSLAELVFRTGLPTLVCERFLADMETAGLIVHPDSEASQAPVWVAPPPRKPRPPAVLERQVAVAAATKPVVQMGLLSRIRLRLGIKSFS